MRIGEQVSEKIFLLAAAVSSVAAIAIFSFMIILGLPIIASGHFIEVLTSPWAPDQGVYGILPMIVGTLAISSLSLIIAFPLSMGCSILITILPAKVLGRLVRTTVWFMTGVPTVVYGFAGVFLLVPIVREMFGGGSGMCILTAAILLALLISPTMILIFVDSFERVPESYLTAVDALGGNRIQKLIHIILPCSRQGILTGLVLAFGRAMGDTMISLMVAGNAVALPGSALDSTRTLTAHIGLIIAADFDSLEFRTLFICGLILYLFTSIMVIMIRSLDSRTGSRAW